MHYVKSLLLKLILLLVFFLNLKGTYSQEPIDSLYALNRFSWERYKMAQEETEQAYNYFKDGAAYFLLKGDTVNHLNCIAHLSDIEHRQAKFNEAFDLLWDALPKANEIANKLPLLEIHQMLGILYQVYGKDSIALHHSKQGLQIAKQYAQNDSTIKGRLTSCYLDVAVQLVAMQEYNTAIQYLDSCYYSDNTNTRLHFVDGIYGQVYLEQHNYYKAQHYLQGVIPFLEERGNGFQTSVNYFMGKLKSKTNQPDSAIYYYNKSLTAIDSLQNNLKLKPLVLEQLAFEYAKTNYNKKAYIYLKAAKQLSDSLFNTQSKQNKVLFEIKNRYKEDLLRKEQELKTNNQLLNISNQARFRLQLLLGLLLLLAIAALVAIRLNAKMKQIAYEKQLNEEKSEVILDIKNKELTANALQIIEKEQAVKELLETVMAKSPETYKKLQRKYKQSNKKIWDDFNLRFTQTNDKFYQNLLEQYPDLTPTDLKHCALVKLNFDSKEMSHLLGISVNSVHMARSRIRKKMNLNREDNLSNFLSKL
ncbi:helix-turn-helix transcriptional regulator [Labilibacter marinus]|uniref:helix-turn-helix transcriptional regulator n=1 Tax=Labilibacter marinus TaxID=1477105 RepID=UPI0009501E2A|nr:hypothetical protein [Labilibacter marinus]